jgi:hypothetical protein
MTYKPWIADEVIGDTGQTGLVIVPARKEVAFTTTTVQAVGATDVSNYRWVSVHIVSQGGSSTVAFQASNDGSQWISQALGSIGSTANPAPVTSTTSQGVIYHGPITAKHFRLNVTGIASGTTSGVIIFWGAPSASNVLSVDTELAAAAALADAASNPTIPGVGAFNLGYNGSTWDRLRSVNTGLLAIAAQAGTVGGYTPGKLISAASTNATNIKASAGTLGYINASNLNAAARYLKVYDKASAPTVGTDTPIAVVRLDPTSMTTIPLPPQGIKCTAGIGIALTTGIADSDTGAVSASEHVVNYGYA